MHIQTPPLKSGSSSVHTPAERGRWDAYTTESLRTLAQTLDSGKDPRYFRLQAIPDVWARHIAFGQSLFDPDHELHDRTLGEWRGLLAAVGLSEWRSGFQFTADRVQLDENDPGFGGIAAKLVPTVVAIPGASWTDLSVISWAGRPVAITSPATIFSLAEEYEIRVPWYDGRHLLDPLAFRQGDRPAVDMLSLGEKEALHAWLGRIRKGIAAGSGSPASSKLQERIREYQDGLVPPSRDFKFIPNRIGYLVSGGTSIAADVPAAPEAGIDSSDVRLYGGRSEETGGIILIAEEASASLGRPTKDIAVWGSVTLASAQSTPLNPNRKELHGQSLGGTEWRVAADFFLPKLYTYKGDGAFSSVLSSPWGSESVSPLLPLQPWILDHIGPEDVAKRTQVRKVSNRYDVTLSVPLKDSGGNLYDVTLTRSYQASDTVLLDQRPVLDIWPNFRASDWAHYYTLYYQEVSRGRTFYGRPRAWRSEREHRQEVSRGEITSEISRTDDFPEALECFDPKDPGSCLGMILIRQPQQLDGGLRPGTWRVGVDFGTTSTTVYRSYEGRAEPVLFESRVVSVMADPANRHDVLRDRFLPPTAAEVPFLSLFKYSQISAEASPIIDGRIYFRLPARDAYAWTNVKADLKWSTSPESRILVTEFIEQLALMIRAEARASGIGKVEWRYSLPTSFTRNQREQLHGIWRTMASGDELAHRSESHSAALYFRGAQKAAPEIGAICIDVGGMSSDIAIWQAGELKLQTSVRCAGRQIIVDSIAGMYENLSELLDHRLDDLDPAIIPLEIQTILTKKQDIEKRLPKYSGHEAVQKLGRSLSLGLGGLLFYSGLLFRHLVESGKCKPAMDGIFIGGNGSKMFSWLNNGVLPLSEPVTQFFVGLFLAGSGQDLGTVRLELTPRERLKHEVAFGLVSSESLSDVADPVIISGERIRTQDETIAEVDQISVPMVRSGVRPESGLPTLRNYADTLFRAQSAAKDRFMPTDPEAVDWGYLETQLTEELARLRQKPEDELDLEPVFIIGLRLLLDEIRKLA
jgi:hypothetical protein